MPGGENACVDIRKRDWSGKMIHSLTYVELEFSILLIIPSIDYSLFVLVYIGLMKSM